MFDSRKDYCTYCDDIVHYELKKETIKRVIREKGYEFVVTKAYCCKCKEEMIVPGLLDLRQKEIDEQYRCIEELVTVKEIEELMKVYGLGKAPLSLALGFGEITITRYLQGQVPSKEFSMIIKQALESPSYMKNKLIENRQKIGETAYHKAMKNVEKLSHLFDLSDDLMMTISYIFYRIHEITPLALQKILYYIQGIYMMKYQKNLFEEDCFAWLHGPVYTNVYNLFKDFKYNPIEDSKYYIIKNKYKQLNKDKKDVIDLVLNSFGIYSGKTLEELTHQETPWSSNYTTTLNGEYVNHRIPKECIREYFTQLSYEYDLNSIEGIQRYIGERMTNNLFY